MHPFSKSFHYPLFWGLFIAIFIPNFAFAAAPILNSHLPADDAVDISVTSDLVLTFSEDIRTNAGTGNILIRRDDGVGGIVTLETIVFPANTSVSGSVLTINPTNDFPVGKSMRIEFDADLVADASSEGYPPNYWNSYLFEMSFTTASGPDIVPEFSFWAILALGAAGFYVMRKQGLLNFDTER